MNAVASCQLQVHMRSAVLQGTTATPLPACRPLRDPFTSISTERSQRGATVVVAAGDRQRQMTVREQLGKTKAADQTRRKKRDREDLYTDNWDGSEWKGALHVIVKQLIIPAAVKPQLDT
mmetsp:Transcript_9753/g.29346  ORF Transcript_9753/g.29346 Transcript_9753/m.29346 type:complete len:120 (+) Transcript_9753:258-617(+)